MYVPVSGVGFINKSRVMVGVVDMTFPIIAYHMLIICAVDCIRSYHGPQLGPINCGMWYLLISILIFCRVFVGFLRAEGAYTSECQMPEDLLKVSCNLACRTKGLTLASARCPRKMMKKRFKLEMVYILVTIQNRLGPWIGIEIREWGWGMLASVF